MSERGEMFIPWAAITALACVGIFVLLLIRFT